jgi:hypothetical protein
LAGGQSVRDSCRGYETQNRKLQSKQVSRIEHKSSFSWGVRVAAGEVETGFQTPSCAFGPDYILSFDGVTRDDLHS